MNVGEFFGLLSYGELSNLSVGNEGTGTLAEVEQPRVISHIQQSLKEIYSRFAHNYDYVILRKVDGLKRYNIRSLYAVSDVTAGNNNTRYLIDTEEDPFAGDIIKIVAVRPINADGELESRDLLINDRSSAASVKTLSYDTLYFSNPIINANTKVEYLEFLVEYQANHPKLDPNVDLTNEIILAPVLESALAMKVASRIYKAMNGPENVAKGKELEASYEKTMALVSWEDLLQVSATDENDRFQDAGWV